MSWMNGEWLRTRMCLKRLAPDHSQVGLRADIVDAPPLSKPTGHSRRWRTPGAGRTLRQLGERERHSSFSSGSRPSFLRFLITHDRESRESISRHRHRSPSALPCCAMLPVCSTAAVLFAGAASWRCTPSPVMNGDSFMFTALRDEGDDPLSVTLPALVAPLSAPLWVGERRQFSPTPQEYKLLASLLDENGRSATSFYTWVPSEASWWVHHLRQLPVPLGARQGC